MKVFIVGAGQVGSTIVEALHAEHELTVVDLDPQKLTQFAYRYDVRTVEATGARRRGDRGLGPRDRLHVPRGGEPRRGRVRAGRGAGGDDGDPRLQRRVRR